MKINEEYLNQNYEEIWKTTTSNGIPIPYLLKKPIDLNINDLNLSEDIKDKLNEAYKNRRRTETEIYRENKAQKKRTELIQEYIEDELINWVKKFPQFKDVLQQE